MAKLGVPERPVVCRGIRERTVAGLRHAKSQGFELGNPRIKVRGPLTLGKVKVGQHRAQLEKVTQPAGESSPIVRKSRPEKAWPAVLGAVSKALPHRAGKYSPKSAWCGPLSCLSPGEWPDQFCCRLPGGLEPGKRRWQAGCCRGSRSAMAGQGG